MKISVYLHVFVFFLFSFCANLSAQNLLINNSNGLFAFDADGCNIAIDVDIDSYTDIATHPNGFLYGVKSNGQLYEINLINGNENLVHDFAGASNFFALTAAADENIFAASGNGALASYNPTTGINTDYANMGFNASGDLTFYQGQMYMATFDNTIVSVHPDNPSANEVFIDFSTSGATIYGIVSSVEGCQVNTYAFSNENNARVYQIDWENQSFDFVCTIPYSVYGGASEFEFNASESLVDIEEINLLNDGCGDAESDIEIIAQSDNGGIVYSLDNETFQTNNIFTDLEPGNYTIYLEDDAGCAGNENFIVFSAFAEATETEVIPSSCGNDNGVITVIGNSGSGLVAYSIDGGNLQQGGTFNNLAPGEYEITVSDLADCFTSYLITIEEAEIENLISLNVSNTSCGEDNGTLEVVGAFGNGELSYNLNVTAFQTQNIYQNLTAGNYEIGIQDTEGCEVMLTFSVGASEILEAGTTEVTEASCGQATGSAQLSSNATGVNYSLDNLNFTDNNIFENLIAGDYTAYYQLTDDCVVNADFTIPESEVSCEIYVPSAFSPNDDGFNDVFKAYSETEVILTKMQIFARWGELVYEVKDLSTRDLNEGWNGVFRGKDMEDGVYIYVISYLKGTERAVLSGDVILLR
ncbi:MAG: gliding motility-associated-like protein [Saprospiraceae bacterium]|jgi:gliding motility-associated-like protein